ATDAPFLSGQARLAVNAAACRRCGLCLSGCVYGAIHSLAPEVDALAAAGALDYQADSFVERLSETAKGVTLRVRHTKSGVIREAEFDYVFVAAGAIQSTRIMLESFGLYGQTLELKDSQKFVLPLLRTRRTPLAWPNNTALAGMFVDFQMPEISRHWIHAQVSSMNDYVLRRLRIDPWKRGMWASILAPLYERMLVAWCGLHSDHSSGMTIALNAPVSDNRPVLQLAPSINPKVEMTVRKIARYFARRVARTGTIALVPMRLLGKPGAGNHFGGSFPMKRAPKERTETDLLGRPLGTRRIHMVDGAVLPSIPATTVVLLQMANADRIASAAEFS
ncbi:MAG: hypothetical protein JOZ70_11705, partial [Pseudolabrys sp.]|nr:hypothetical protein [Pseudolabrys sp.]